MLYNLYLSSLILSGVIAGALVYYFWLRRSQAGAAAMSWMMSAIAIISFGYAVEIISSNLFPKILATNIEYIGFVAAPVAWMVFALRYTGQDRGVNKRNILLLSIIPVITLVLAWTNSSHKALRYWPASSFPSPGM